jgi:hypothetical protein
MPVLRTTSAVAIASAAVALTGCGASPRTVGDDPGSSSSSAPTSAVSSATVPTEAATAATSTGSATPTGVATTTGCEATAGVPDGTWTGPITMDVDGKAGNAGFASSQGKGRMKLIVKGGNVTSGTWKVTWTSEGHADTGQAAANIRLTGTIGGGARGPATKPVLLGTWAIHGTATITKPVHSSAPVDETGKDTATLALDSVSCDAVTGSFMPSFNSKDAAATFTGTARWSGRPQG